MVNLVRNGSGERANAHALSGLFSVPNRGSPGYVPGKPIQEAALDPRAKQPTTPNADIRFFLPDGREVPVVTRSQMQEIDRIAVEETGPNLLQMMENAGRSLAERALARLSGKAPEARVVVMAGPGGNGGGGICAARHLAPRVARLDLCLTEMGTLSEAAARQLAVYRATDGNLVSLVDLENGGSGGRGGPEAPLSLVLDAVIGYSLAGAPRGTAQDAIRWIGAAPAPVLSLDLPSGMDADTGDTPGVHVTAHDTLTLHLPKPGLRSLAAGALWVADLGIPIEANRRAGVAAPGYGPGFVVPLQRGGGDGPWPQAGRPPLTALPIPPTPSPPGPP
jgi:NAD(P)H-hydrate epimerase